MHMAPPQGGARGVRRAAGGGGRGGMMGSQLSSTHPPQNSPCTEDQSPLQEYTMALAWHLMIFALLLPRVQLASGLDVNVGDSVNLTATGNCGEQSEFKVKTSDNTRTVATRVRGVWEPAGGYTGRVEHVSRSSLRIKRVNYNDKGLFEFSCGNTVITLIDVTVVVPFDVSVEEGGSALLSCHHTTAGGEQRVRWDRNGELVLEVEHPSGQTRYGGEFEGRASLSPDWHSTGNLSLTLREVQFEDQADFTCSIDEDRKRKRGNPAAVRLTVNRRDPAEIPSTPAYEPPTETSPAEKMGTGTIISVILNVVLFLVLLVCLCLYLKYCKSNASPGATGGGGPSGDEELRPFTAPPPGSQVNGGPPAPN